MEKDIEPVESKKQIPTWVIHEIKIPPGNYQDDADLLREIEKQIPTLPDLSR